MSNFPLAYKLSWLPRLLNPSLAGERREFAPSSGALLDPPPARAARLVFVGDISAVANRTAPVVHPAIHALLESADLVVGNCESPVVERPGAPLRTALGVRHVMSGRFLAEALDAAGIARDRLVLSIANNHALDQGVDGFNQTLATLQRLGIRAVGTAGETMAMVSVAAPSALTVGLVAFTQWRNASRAEFAGRVAMAYDAQAWSSSDRHGCDLLCILPHWDWEFRHFPQPETRTLARKLADGGAGIIVGGHAHVVQPMQRLDGSLVAYGLGDFLGTALARAPWPIRIGALLAVDVSLDAATRGRIAGYRLQFFLRERDGSHERLTPVEALDASMRDRVFDRLDAIYGQGPAV